MYLDCLMITTDVNITGSTAFNYPQNQMNEPETYLNQR